MLQDDRYTTRDAPAALSSAGNLRTVSKAPAWRAELLPVVFILVTALCLFAPRTGWSHDVPDEIVLTGFAKAEGDQLNVLVRVPLIMLTSINLPKWGPGYLALDRLDTVSERMLAAVSNQMRFYENGRLLQYQQARYRISQPSERIFGSYDDALAHVVGPQLPADARVFWNQGYLDVYLQYPVASSRSTFSVDFGVGTGLSGRLKLAMLFIPQDGPSLAYMVHGNANQFALNPQWHHAALLFVKQGFHHILDGTDHLLFLLCLIIPFRLRGFRSLVAVITSFTVAHSVTLIASALGLVPEGDWFMPLVEVLIAISILYIALENVVAVWWKTAAAHMLGWRWAITGAFGLVHGFGFSFALREDLQFAGSHLLTSLVAFNIGVELGQLLVLLLVLPTAALIFRTPRSHHLGVVIVSVLVGHTAWHWAGERAQDLRYVQWPELLGPPFLMAISLALLLSVGIGLSLRAGRTGRSLRGSARRTTSI